MTAALARPAAFRGFRFPPDLITVAVRWYLRYNLSYRDLEELLAERGVQVDHVTIHRWVRRFTPLFIDAARDHRLPVGRRWHVDETYIRVGGAWRYLYRAIDEHGQVVDVLFSERRDATAAREFFLLARLRTTGLPEEVVTDRAPMYPQVLRDLLPWVTHDMRRHANCRIESDHARLKARLKPMHGLKQDRSAGVIVAGHAFVQNLRRGHYHFGDDVPRLLRCKHAFSRLTRVA